MLDWLFLRFIESARIQQYPRVNPGFDQDNEASRSVKQDAIPSPEHRPAPQEGPSSMLVNDGRL